MKNLKLIIVLLCVFVFTGCSSSNLESNAVDLVESTQSEQSIWILLDSDGEMEQYLYEDDADVKEVIQLIKTHVACVDNRAFNDLKLSEEWDTYTTAFQELLTNAKYQEALENLYSNNALVIFSTVTYWNKGEMDSGRLYCKVMVDSVFQFLEGSEEYFQSLGVETNKDYIESRIYYCSKDTGEWKISSIEKSALSVY